MFSYRRGFYVCKPAHDDGYWKWHNSDTHIEHTCVRHTADGIGIRKDDIGDPDLVQESRVPTYVTDPASPEEPDNESVVVYLLSKLTKRTNPWTCFHCLPRILSLELFKDLQHVDSNSVKFSVDPRVILAHAFIERKRMC